MSSDRWILNCKGGTADEFVEEFVEHVDEEEEEEGGVHDEADGAVCAVVGVEEGRAIVEVPHASIELCRFV